jgi:hypothetical protein
MITNIEERLKVESDFMEKQNKERWETQKNLGLVNWIIDEETGLVSAVSLGSKVRLPSS